MARERESWRSHRRGRDAFDHDIDASRLAAGQRSLDRGGEFVGGLHQFAVTAQRGYELGLVNEKADVPRSLRVSIPKGDIPALEDVLGPPW